MAKNKLCDSCTGLCCRYFALPIETPETREDYDDIRWYLCHKNVTVFVEDGDWYINIINKCRHLDNGSHQCNIYKDRPAICRRYKTADCDLTEGDYDFDMHFTDDGQIAEYMRVKFDNKRKNNKKRKKKKKK